MLTRKQQWRRTRVRRGSCAAAAAASSGTGKKPTTAAGDLEGHHERADSDQATLSAWSSFDSLGEGDDDGDSCSAVPLARPSPAAAERSVSFQQEVQVFLVTHKSEIDTSAKQALWWTGRDAAINKRAWLHHLGQPGCGRQSAGRPRPKHHHQHHHQQQQYHQHHNQQHQHQDRSSHFLGAGRNTAAGRGLGGGAMFTHNSNSNNNGGGGGREFDGEEQQAPPDATEPLPAGGVGILGCRCEACLTEGDEHELDLEQQERLQRQRWRREEREEQQLPPRYAYNPPPPPYNHQPPPPRYNEAYSRPTGVPHQASPGAWRGRAARAARGASKSWPSPEDWDREDDLGGKGSRSYSPGSASGSSPLHEACETYDDEGSYFFDN